MFFTSEFIAKPSSTRLTVGGMTSITTSLRLRLICRSSFMKSGQKRLFARSLSSLISSLHLHAAHARPSRREEEGAQGRERDGHVPDGGPAAAAHEGVARHLDVVARGYQVRPPAHARRDVRDGEDEPRQKVREQEAGVLYRLDGGRAVWDARADHRAEGDATEEEQERADEERRRVALEPQAEHQEREHERQSPLGGGDDDEREYLPQEVLVRRDARHVDLQNGLLLALARDGQRREQRGKQREPHGEDARPGEL